MIHEINKIKQQTAEIKKIAEEIAELDFSVPEVMEAMLGEYFAQLDFEEGEECDSKEFFYALVTSHLKDQNLFEHYKIALKKLKETNND